jgi:hypothetical protein
MGIAGEPVQVRNHDGAGVDTSEGPFLRSDLPIAGFALIEAATLEEAVSLASKTPCAVAHGVVEVWPLGSTWRDRATSGVRSATSTLWPVCGATDSP